MSFGPGKMNHRKSKNQFINLLIKMSFGKGLRVQRMITLSKSNPLTLKTINPNSIVTTRMQYSQMVAIIRGIHLEILLGKNGRGGR